MDRSQDDGEPNTTVMSTVGAGGPTRLEAGRDGVGGEVTGRIYRTRGAPAAEVELRLYRRGFRGSSTLLAEGTSGPDGSYTLRYERGGPMNLEVRAVGPDAHEVALTGTICDPNPTQTLNLVAPASVAPEPSEFARLHRDVSGHLDGGRLGEAREGAGNGDLSLLHCDTGWDARVLAAAASADRLARETGIEAEALYGLLRLGLPAEATHLAALDDDTLVAGLSKASRAGAIALTDEQARVAIQGLRSYARSYRRAHVCAPGTLSTVGELLAVSGLTEAEQDAFDTIVAGHDGDAAALWTRARAAGLSAEKVSALQLQGKLSLLTFNNAPLTVALQRQIGSVAELAPRLLGWGFHTAEAWESYLSSWGKGDEAALAGLIPPRYAGGTVAERVRAYAEDLARKVRLALPTQVLTRRIESGELRLGAAVAASSQQVATALQRADGLGFQFGQTPAGRFVRTHADALFAGFSTADADATAKALVTLQRLYQITPSDQAMQVLLDLGYTSAYHVTSYEADDFTAAHANDFGSAALTRQVYAKARLVSSATYNAFGTAAVTAASPPVYVLSPTGPVAEEATNAMVEHLPTLETLFGELDFCDCDHCRSVLSPAAYLVDLLHFLDPAAAVWQTTVKNWKSAHGAPYPFDSPQSHQSFLADWSAAHPNQPAPPAELSPYEQLTRRRPDLPRLQLTCENTNTVLPYIDIVNEILEYAVAHGQLDATAARDAGDAQSEDLLCEPQFVLGEAYDILSQARYPLGLPFDLWLETVRRFLDALDAPLPAVLEALCPTDDLAVPANAPAGRTPYGRRAVFASQLELGEAEYEVLTSPQRHAAWFELYGYQDAATAVVELAGAKRLSRRLGVSYREIVDLVRTGFVNPRLDTLVVLRKLDLDVSDVLRYFDAPGVVAFTVTEKAAFAQKLTDLTAQHGGAVDVATWLTGAWTGGDFAQLLVLADPEPGCDFEHTTLRYADGAAAGELAFLQLNLLVRLRRRLGWDLAELDAALQTFLPAASSPVTVANLGEAMASALLGIAHLEALAGRVRVGRSARRSLPALWTTLSPSLYAELFLTPGVRASDPAFDHPLGQYLSAAGELLVDHVATVQAALNLTAADVEAILADAGRSLATEPLSLDAISLLYRYRLLAKGLKLPIAELIVLKALSGVDPFTPLPAAPVTMLGDDVAFTSTLRFVELAATVHGSGLRLDELTALLRHDVDPAGPLRDRPEETIGLVRVIAAEIIRIAAEHAVPADALSFTDETLAQKAMLALPAEVAATFLAMWSGSIATYAVVSNVAEIDRLDPDGYAGEPAVTVSYDAARQQQHLTYRGVLVDAERTRLKNAYPSALLAELLDQISAQAKEFFTAHLQSSVVAEEPVGFLVAADFVQLFSPAPADADTSSELQDWQRARRARLAEAFLPYLRGQLIRRFVLATLTTQLGADPVAVESLASHPALLRDPAEPVPVPLLAAFTGVGEAGLSLAYYATPDATGAPVGTATVTDVSTGTKPAGAASARVSGYLEVPVTGAYRFALTRTADTGPVELRFEHLSDPLLRAAAGADEVEAYLELRAGVPYGINLVATGLGAGADVSLRVRAENLAMGALGRLTCYPAHAVERLRRAHVLLGKVIRLASALGLSEAALRHVATHPADFGGVDLSLLPTRPDDPTAAPATVLFGAFERLAGLHALAEELDAGVDEVIDVIRPARREFPADADPTAATAEVLADVCDRFAALVRRPAATVRDAADQLGVVATASGQGDGLAVVVQGLTDERGLRRLWSVLAIARTLGVAPAAVGRWADPAPAETTARDLRATLHARYEPEAWRRVAKPVFDGLRRSRRDALVAHLLDRDGYDRLEQLYEHFLIDPGTEPVVRTSRLRLAISSVQLFVQRCLLNLEFWVPPSTIKASHWAWMNRYRVWEANRKIFLWPENWLEPEFRDDKTHLFRVLEGTLLASDITDEHAEDAFFAYLTSLEELARLEIMSTWLDEDPDDPAYNVLHVVGRTHNTPARYFYRRFAQRAWTPWEPVGAEVEGEHVVLTIWRDRPHLFWLTFLDRAQPATDFAAGEPPTEVEVQLHWSGYANGEWSAGAGTGFDGAYVALLPPDFARTDLFVHASVERTDEVDEVTISVWPHDDATPLDGKLHRAFQLVSKNSRPVVVGPVLPADPALSTTAGRGGRYHGSGPLKVSYTQKIEIDPGSTTVTVGTEKILGKGGKFELVVPPRPVANVGMGEISNLVRPFFYQDRRRTFFVEPTVLERKLLEHDGWVLEVKPKAPHVPGDLVWLEELPIDPAGPVIQQPEVIATHALYGIQTASLDPVAGAAAKVTYDGVLIGSGGAVPTVVKGQF